MNASTLTTLTFLASTPAGNLPGVVSYADSTASLKLNSLLPPNTVVTATVTVGAKSTTGNRLLTNKVWKFTTGSTGDVTAPTVSSTDPSNAETGVPLNKSISVVFSEPMSAGSITATTLKVSSGGTAVSGTVSVLNNIATFKPTASLAANTMYSAIVTTAAQDLSNNPMAADYTWSFTTGAIADTTAPRIASTDPANLATGVSLNKSVSVTFTEAMDPKSITASSFYLRGPDGSNVPSAITCSGSIATLNPTGALTANTTYSCLITKTVKDTAGNSLAAPKAWVFKTAAVLDSTAPTVIRTNPANGATNVFLNKSINATFSEAMRASTITTSTFKVVGVPGTVSYDSISHIGSYKPSVDLLPNTTYTARVETGVADSAGNHMLVAKVWTFMTGIQRAQTNINLGAASTYAVLAGSTVTNGGPTIINGDLGVSPGTSVVGFPPGKVNGAIHSGDAAAAKAKSDLLIGQLELAGLLGAATLPGDLSGLTFTPGLYKNSTSVMLSAGHVTLDAQGDSNAVFVFQMGSTLTTSPGTQVVLAGGAKAANIYWSVGSSATLGVGSIFKGIILAEVSITVNSNVVHDGTLLTKTGAVTLQSNVVTRGFYNKR